MIKRIFVEKKTNCAIEASSILKDIKENLNISNLENVRILNCYDFLGVSDNDYELCKTTIFSEPPVDNIYEEKFDVLENEICFAVKYLKGQFDQRADSCNQCVQIVSVGTAPLIEVSKFFVLKGDITKSELQKIKNYCINPVDSTEVALDKPTDINNKTTPPEKIKIHKGFILKNKEELNVFLQELSLAMSISDLILCQQYFKNTEKRDPSYTEIKVIDTYWSDHCRHTTFLTKIENIEFEDGYYKNLFEKAYNIYLDERKIVYENKERDICLMDLAVIGMKTLKKKGILDNLDESEEINACSIVVNVDVDGQDEEWLIMFKNETHNHPTEIEPFGGAATCLGGAIRDPLSGRSYVYQAMRVTGSGDPRKTIDQTLQGKLSQRKITTGAALGYSSYGNQIGLATGIVNEVYDDGYIAKRMEIGAVVGAVKREHVVREVPKSGDIIVMVGGRTGRDGCGGATGSSKEHTEESINTSGAEVQKGNAPTERKLQRLFRNPNCSKLIKRCNDFGAGGVCVAVAELAEGIIINLDAVLKKYDGLDGTELAISESQERMAVVLDKADVSKFIKFSEDENLEAVIVAEVTQNPRVIFKWQDENIVNISREFLNTNGALQKTNVIVTSPEKFVEPKTEKYNIEDKWLENLSRLNVCSQKGLGENFDSTIGAGTVLMPFGGKHQLTPIQSMAALVPLQKGNTNTATLMSFGYDPYISKWSPFHGGLYAVVESVSKIVATGGDYNTIRLSFQEYFERLGTDFKKWGKPFASLLGAFYAQVMLGTPAIGGKDSMSGTFNELTVPPTLVSFSLTTAKVQNIISPEFKRPDTKIILIKTKIDDNDIPDFDILIKNYILISKLIKSKNILSAHTIGIGGIAAVISKMSLGNKIGATIQYDNLFKEMCGSFVIEFEGDLQLISDCDSTLLGATTTKETININDFNIDLEKILKAYLLSLENVFPTNLLKDEKKADISIKPFEVKVKTKSINKTSKPRVFIPVFPGTNCEGDSERAFAEAGAIVETFVFKNINSDSLNESIKKMTSIINNSQIIFIPGGFSAGDEPDGSGKFIATVFRNPYIKEATMNLLNNKDGLMLGICNGFQALVKLGLLPYGIIEPMKDNSPTLTFNEIGRHISGLSTTKIVSNKSPWLWNVNVGDIHTIPVSHGEGKFLADEQVIKSLISNNQIATQYVDFDNNPTYSIKHNQNGSLYAIEGITSMDGRIFGKMGHSERIGKYLYKNVLGHKDQKIFVSGVQYFS